MDITVTFTEPELVALRQLIDLAVRQGGMNCAEAAVVLNNKLLAAVNRAKGNGGPPEFVQPTSPS
jgi:hypothetical protein